MHIEHLGLNVPEPVTIAAWYVRHMGFTVKRKVDAAPWTHFLADESGRVMLEIYGNPAAEVPDYRQMNPLVLHVAFTVADVRAERDRLVAAGAASIDEITITPAGDTMAMLRDPWGVPIQIVKRAEAMTR